MPSRAAHEPDWDDDDDPEGPQDCDLDDPATLDDADVVECPHCGAEISELAEQCPRCGDWVALSEARPLRSGLAVALALAALAAAGVWVLVR